MTGMPSHSPPPIRAAVFTLENKMNSIVLAALDYAIEQAEILDAKLHEIAGQVDAVAHAALVRLKALREKVAQALGVFGATADHYAQLGAEDQAAVDAQFAAMQSA